MNEIFDRLRPENIMQNATKLDTKVMESRHHIGAGLTAAKKTVTVKSTKQASKPGAKKWDRQ